MAHHPAAIVANAAAVGSAAVVPVPGAFGGLAPLLANIASPSDAALLTSASFTPAGAAVRRLGQRH